MRLLLLFLFCYFVYRYGRYLFTQFQTAKPHQATATQQQSAHQSSSSANANEQGKKNDVEGEYVDFEEIK